MQFWKQNAGYAFKEKIAKPSAIIFTKLHEYYSQTSGNPMAYTCGCTLHATPFVLVVGVSVVVAVEAVLPAVELAGMVLLHELQ